MKIIEIVKEHQPISGETIAKQLGLSRATLRNDLSILTMTGLLDARPKVGYFYTGQTVEPLLFEKLYHTKVAEIMIPPLLISQTVSVYEAVTTLFMYDVGSLYVKNDQDELIDKDVKILTGDSNFSKLRHHFFKVLKGKTARFTSKLYTKDQQPIDANITAIPIVINDQITGVIGIAQDITENRPPLSRWHPDWSDAFADWMKG